MKHFIYGIFLIGISLTARSQGVGINTTSPEATLHVKGSGTMDPFMVEYGDSTKLKTFRNGGTSVGSATMPPKDGLYVKGTLQPDSGISTPQKLLIESVGKSITLKAGRSTIVMDANGNISITASDLGGDISITSKLGGNISITSNIGGNISIASNNGGNIGIQSSNGKLNLSGNELNLSGTTLNLTGNFVNINATNALKIKGGAAAEISAAGSMDIKGGIIKLNGGGRPAARVGDQVNISTGIIVTGSPTVLVN